MSAIRATVIMVAMLFTMIAIVTGISASGGDGDRAVILDGYGISSHIGQH